MKETKEIERLSKFLVSDGDVSLTTYQEDLLDKLDFADNSIRKFGEEKARKMLMNRYNMPKSTSYRYISNAKILFASVSRIDKEYMRRVVNELIYEGLQAIRCETDPTKKGTGIIKAALSFIKSNNLDKETVDTPNFEMFEQHIFDLKYDPSLINPDAENVTLEQIDKLVAKYMDGVAHDAEIIEDA